MANTPTLSDDSVVDVGLLGLSVIAGSVRRGFSAVREAVTLRGTRVRLVQDPSELSPSGSREPSLIPEGLVVRGDGPSIFGKGINQAGVETTFYTPPLRFLVLSDGTQVSNLTSPDPDKRFKLVGTLGKGTR